MTFEIKLAEEKEASIVHKIMLEAFEEYRNLEVPSSAINEPLTSIQNAIKTGKEQAILFYQDGEALGCSRLQLDETSLYFARLSVPPQARGKGIAKKMIKWIEKYAKGLKKKEVRCRVRLALASNIQLYQAIGYKVVKEETVLNPNGFPVKTVIMNKQL
ncbi:GNAT family N-acetyltransferase [Chengkuizengella axinellae]|uniref:GNAT family N-acetyltransferase n=1 Tax=Chengkuizengella axinellae TaxID=3064388 RepID=A0ABT9IZF6_9BACL|nr:GNAT family N-acetyltransferase [Chengkuizengella sp. 2205SS18-9]MDP5274764.1 GNAT family N-acetyltransferase [Chengkuizengella sp. 2205SS18-9]